MTNARELAEAIVEAMLLLTLPIWLPILLLMPPGCRVVVLEKLLAFNNEDME